MSELKLEETIAGLELWVKHLKDSSPTATHHIKVLESARILLLTGNELKTAVLKAYNHSHDNSEFWADFIAAAKLAGHQGDTKADPQDQ